MNKAKRVYRLDWVLRTFYLLDNSVKEDLNSKKTTKQKGN